MTNPTSAQLSAKLASLPAGHASSRAKAPKSSATSARDVCVVVPIKAVSEANSHTHWRIRARRAKDQRQATWTRLRWSVGPDAPPLPVTVTLTRLAPRELDDDNLHGSLKHFRDGVADWFGVDDRDKRYTWRVRQEKAKAYGVRIEVSAAPVGEVQSK